jgi:Zn-finger nucleic acid-binding protein
MVKFRLICPDCDAALITSSPEAMVWELCPSCRKHIWDIYDALMADVVADRNPLNKMGNHVMRGDARDNN